MNKRVKVKKHEKVLDPTVVATINEITKDYRDRMAFLEKTLETLIERMDNQLIILENHEVMFGDLHTTFCTLETSVAFSSAKQSLVEFSELGARSLCDYELPPEQPEPLFDHEEDSDEGEEF